ncbi:MAG: MerR family transcriptional regulator [Chloroflexi bacterium]|nr:MerR family transcriptional regulator [Chloroflexota bacterium]
MSEELLKPAEVCKRLDLAPSTLRIYSAKFRELLSGAASGAGVGGHRLYSSRDVLVLSRAKELLGQGLTYDQTLAELKLAMAGVKARGKAEAKPAEAPREATSGVLSPDVVVDMIETLKAAVGNADKALQASRDLLELEGRRIERLEARMEALEAKVGELLENVSPEGGAGRRKEPRRGWWPWR